MKFRIKSASRCNVCLLRTICIPSITRVSLCHRPHPNPGGSFRDLLPVSQGSRLVLLGLTNRKITRSILFPNKDKTLNNRPAKGSFVVLVKSSVSPFSTVQILEHHQPGTRWKQFLTILVIKISNILMYYF